jgi:GTP pyrophosphokinase
MANAARLHEEIRDSADSESAARAAAEGASLVEILDALRPDPEIRAAALLFPLAASGVLPADLITKRCGAETRRLVRELVKLGSFGLPPRWAPGKPLPAAQAETLRRMLLAIVADVRLVTVRLAEQLRRMRDVKRAGEAQRERVATETRIIFAPLANRLGIWHLKWELEDLAFRYLEPDTYHGIAKALRERRSERERRIAEVIGLLSHDLEAAGIEASIKGRPKHIYSIWRKMQRKGVGLESIFDVSAVRVLVKNIADCYAVLGIVHSLWPYLPGEFDDYIANPKGNDYQSLHTAVIGPGDEPLEVQIRTWEMDAHAELGVAAHWRYKEGGGASAAFERKIKWLRQLLEPGDEDPDRDFIERIGEEVFEDRVYAVTPDGDVVDLPAGATPLDFAYYVHTDVGHHCRGAKVNGRMVQLTHRIENGDKVEIITAQSARPSRDWLIPQRGYLASARSRNKVRGWFRRQDQEQNRKQGRAMLEKELQRLAVAPNLQRLVEELHQPDADALYLAIGAGDVTLGAVAHAVDRIQPAPTEEPAALQETRRRPRPGRKAGGIVVSGVGDLMTHLARCCRPVPPEDIAGYLTLGRGVSIHRQDCSNLLRLRESNPERIMAVEWGESGDSGFTAEITVDAYDRRGLLRDISSVLTDEHIDIIASNTRTDRARNVATIDLTVVIRGMDQLSRLLHRIGGLANVYAVRRRG